MKRLFALVALIAALLLGGSAVGQSATITGRIDYNAPQKSVTQNPTKQQGRVDGDCMQYFPPDITIPDGTVLKSGATNQVKTWRIGNCGTTDWKGYTLDLTVGGVGDWNKANPHPKNPSYLTFASGVKPGQTVDISIYFTVPQPGNDTVYFEMTRPDTRRFGDVLWLSIVSQ